MILLKPWHNSQLGHHIILEMTATVSENILWNSEVNDDLVEHEKSYKFDVSSEGRHFLCPLSEVINTDNDIFVPPSRN